MPVVVAESVNRRRAPIGRDRRLRRSRALEANHTQPACGARVAAAKPHESGGRLYFRLPETILLPKGALAARQSRLLGRPGRLLGLRTWGVVDRSFERGDAM